MSDEELEETILEIFPDKKMYELGITFGIEDVNYIRDAIMAIIINNSTLKGKKQIPTTDLPKTKNQLRFEKHIDTICKLYNRNLKQEEIFSYLQNLN